MKRRFSFGWVAAIIIIAVILLDQIVKIWVKTHFYYGEQYQITSWFSLVFIENNGMAFGWEMGSKMLLTWFRIIAVLAFGYYLFKIRHRDDLPMGYVVFVAMITAGAAGNVIDCIAYGQIFNSPAPPQLAQMFPPDGGYAPLFNGRVVDMLYFPLCEWNWPDWMPAVGGDHFVFFQPIFNIADAALTTGVLAIILFYSRHLTAKEETTDESEDSDPSSDTARDNFQEQE